MVYMGSLTPDSDDPFNFLKIPNLFCREEVLDQRSLLDMVYTGP
jgi:hypothetical protein